MVERAENGRELCLFDKRRLSEEELIQTYKNRTPPRANNVLIASGDFKKTEQMTNGWKTKDLCIIR